MIFMEAKYETFVPKIDCVVVDIIDDIGGACVLYK